MADQLKLTKKELIIAAALREGTDRIPMKNGDDFYFEGQIREFTSSSSLTYSGFGNTPDNSQIKNSHNTTKGYIKDGKVPGLKLDPNDSNVIIVYDRALAEEHLQGKIENAQEKEGKKSKKEPGNKAAGQKDKSKKGTSEKNKQKKKSSSGKKGGASSQKKDKLDKAKFWVLPLILLCFLLKDDLEKLMTLALVGFVICVIVSNVFWTKKNGKSINVIRLGFALFVFSMAVSCYISGDPVIALIVAGVAVTILLY